MQKKFYKVVSVSNNSRLFAILMAFSGGALDVYSHNYFHGLVATQTGNIILMASNLSQYNWQQMLPKIVSIILFTVGFLLGILLKRSNFSHYWRSYTMLPVILSSLIIPLLSQNLHLFKIGLLAFGSGLLMLTFTGTQIEGNPYTIMMTSGNYRKMLNEWYLYLTSRNKTSLQRRNAHNYTIVVLSFVIGACLLAFVSLVLKKYSIWIVTFTFLLALFIEIHQAKKTIR
ncbi:hypothetical protein IGI86_003329 [Enterococcus sp. AZ188]|uniref:YoaK family protein n=1 Tax=Enterococcus TaxID=1350 RepID=UPI003D2FFFBA